MDVRNRSRSNYSATEHVGYTRSTFNTATGKWSAPYSYYSSDFVPEMTVENMTDIVTPDFVKRSAKGEIFNNPLTQSKVFDYQNMINYSFEYIRRFKSNYTIAAGSRDTGTVTGIYPATVRGYGGFLPPPTFDDDDLEDLKGQAVAKAYSNINTSDTLALVTLLELEKTLFSLGGILKHATKLYRYCLKRSARYGRRNALKNFRLYADLWMEARYSLRPLYYDVVGLLKALDRPLSKLDRATFRGSASYSDGSDDSITVALSDAGHTGSYFTVNRKSSIDIEARSGCLCQTNPETRATSLGLYEIPLTLWEIVPFSFIVDWFLNVGDIIGAWTPRMGSTVLASWVVVTTTITQSVNVSAPVNGAPIENSTQISTGAGYTWSPGVKMKISTTKVRSPNSSRPILPSFDVRLSPAKLLDLGIIVSQFKDASKSLAYRL